LYKLQYEGLSKGLMLTLTNNMKGLSMATKKPASKKKEAAAALSVFGQAPEIATPEVAKGGKERDQHPMGDDKNSFEGYVSLILIEKAIKGMKESMAGYFKGKAFDIFSSLVAKTGTQPEAFDGTEGCAVAQFQFKKTATVTPALADILTKNSVSHERTESVPECFVINPLLLKDQIMMGKLALAIQNVQEELGIDYNIIEKQKPVYKYHVTKKSIVEVSQIEDPKVRSELMQEITSIAVAQGSLEVEAGEDVLQKAFDIVRKNGILNID
jgi:hypothetical protein